MEARGGLFRSMTSPTNKDMTIKLTKDIARKVLSTVDKGLVNGLGVREEGKMCIEAAVCFALGLPHGDNPPCVGSAVRSFKISLNDQKWPTDKDRTKEKCDGRQCHVHINFGLSLNSLCSASSRSCVFFRATANAASRSSAFFHFSIAFGLMGDGRVMVAGRLRSCKEL